MYAQQEKERLDLHNLHRQETAALARQHIAERLSVHEKWRALSLDKQANRIDARLTAHQGMAAQQKAAHRHDQAACKGKPERASANGSKAAPANPREASRAYIETAHAEEAKHTAIRDKLLKTRAQESRTRRTRGAEEPGSVCADDSKLGIAAQRRTAPPSARARQRETLAPGIQAARNNRAARIQERLSEIDPQQQIRHAAESGRPLSSEERANASPEIKEHLAREDRQAKDRSFFTGGNSPAGGSRQTRTQRGWTGPITDALHRPSTPHVFPYPGPYAAGLFRPAHSHVRKRITRFVSTLSLPAGSPLSHRARQACIFAYASKNTGLFRSPFPLDDSRACW